jgi:hypothetical protein
LHFSILSKFNLLFFSILFDTPPNFLGQPVQEFSATTITVMWGMWYMKAVYMIIAGLIGFGLQRALYPEENYF